MAFSYLSEPKIVEMLGQRKLKSTTKYTLYINKFKDKLRGLGELSVLHEAITAKLLRLFIDAPRYSHL